MAKAPGIEFREKLSDVIECSICADIFSNPKILPCVHTFCLHCLEKYENYEKLQEKMACPICRNEFVIPVGGLSKLPNNFFIGKIIEIGKLATAPAKEEVCELCSEETAVAKKFCIDCEQKLCDRCITLHNRMKHCHNHQVIEIGSQLNFQELNFRDSYCEHHPKELIKMFCHKDDVAICLICFAESHQSHKCSNVDKVAGQFTEQLKDDLSKVAIRRPECEDALEKLDKFKTEFTEEVLKTEENIRKSGAELKELIDHHIEELVQNLRVVRDRNLKCFETTKQDVGRFKVMIDSYQRYCDELLTRGSPVDICRDASQMHKRANDLEKQPVNCSLDDLVCDQIYFHCEDADILMQRYVHVTNNVVGELRVTKSTNRIVRFQKKILEMVVPTNWETMKNYENFKIIQLDASDQEYKDIEKAVLSSAKSLRQIVKIERIQNKVLYKQYVERKAAMDAADPGIQNEMTLWYGTSADTLDSINRTGFNRSYCGRKGNVFGIGVYFAKYFKHTAQYSPPDANGYSHVYQCKVLTGDYAVGSGNIVVPPFKPGSTTVRYDSTVGNVANPNIFVIFDDIQAYPEYLIYFK